MARDLIAGGCEAKLFFDCKTVVKLSHLVFLVPVKHRAFGLLICANTVECRKIRNKMIIVLCILVPNIAQIIGYRSIGKKRLIK
jgi:hypothetical protein